MDDVELTDAQLKRIDSLRAELASKTGPYATVTAADTIEYLLDVAAEIDNPDPVSTSLAEQLAESTASQPFPRAALRDQLETRRLSHGDQDDAERMDLYTIAVEFDIEGRSSMSKSELIDAILDTAEQQYTNPFSSVDIDFPGATDTDTEAKESVADDEAETDSEGGESDDTDESGDDDEDAPSDDDSGQLNAMLSLMETHDDKWWATDGDARYKVELPDGSVESARTKDDVRAMLFTNY
ncbi:MAG: Rho termination factor, N-terminal domain protein [Halonotius sp. J07HN4]|nr:MAG: Rho termination factor, N-terminal domain protein [Halonotius sp. J07HN4]